MHYYSSLTALLLPTALVTRYCNRLCPSVRRLTVYLFTRMGLTIARRGLKIKVIGRGQGQTLSQQ